MNYFDFESKCWAIKLIFETNKPSNEKDKFNVLELFAGIGAQHKALQNIKYSEFDVFAISEWDAFALISYVSIHHKWDNNSFFKVVDQLVADEKIDDFLFELGISLNGKLRATKLRISKLSENIKRRIAYACIITRNFGDISNLIDFINLDFDGLSKYQSSISLLTYSFPCTDLSNQGSAVGLNGVHSGLLWKIGDLLNSYKNKFDKVPNYLLMENVTAIVNNKFGGQFKKWIKILEKFGYKNWNSQLSAVDFGIPQTRKRQFMVSHFENEFNIENSKIEPKNVRTYVEQVHEFSMTKLSSSGFIKPFSETFSSMEDLISKNQYEKLLDFVNDENKKSTSFYFSSDSFGKFSSEFKVQVLDGYSPTLTAEGAQARLKFFIRKGEYNFNENSIGIISGATSYLLMGFEMKDVISVTNGLFDTFGNIQSTSRKQIITNYPIKLDWIMRKQAGNSIVVNVIQEIIAQIYKRWNEK